MEVYGIIGSGSMKYLIEEDHLYNLLDTLRKAVDTTPSFKMDKNSGEGTASPDEVAYTQALNDLLEEAYNQVIVIDPTLSMKAKIAKVDKIVNSCVSAQQKTAKKHLTDIYIKSQDKANAIAEKNKLPTSNDRSILTQYLLPYQINAIRKNGVILREQLVDLLYRIQYFGAAYHGKDST